MNQREARPAGVITPFAMAADDETHADLRARLRRTRWPEPATVGGWTQGVPLAELQALCGYWADDYDWRAAEARLNRMPQMWWSADRLLGLPEGEPETVAPVGREAVPGHPLLGEPVRGGHFAAFEQPALFVAELRAGWRAMRS